jgi:putative transcriptional regulator
MADLPTPLDLVHQAISSGVFGQSQWDDRADERARSNRELQGLTPEGIRRLLHDFVCGGGRLDQRHESRPDWLKVNADRPSFYPISGIGPLYQFQAFFRMPCSSRSGCSMTTRKTHGWKLSTPIPKLRRLPKMTTRKFPKRCGKCGQQAMRLATVPFTTTIEHDGRAYRVDIPDLTVPQCARCQAISIDDEADRQITAAFRRQARLLSPEEIRQGREKLGMTQKEFANLLGVGESTFSRWENGVQIQQRAMDRFLRVCLASPAAVELLQSDFQPTAQGA